MVGADAGLDYLVWEWCKESGEWESWKTPPDVPRVLDHPHDASMFVLEADGSPWLGEFFRGIGQESSDVEDLFE